MFDASVPTEIIHVFALMTFRTHELRSAEQWKSRGNSALTLTLWGGRWSEHWRVSHYSAHTRLALILWSWHNYYYNKNISDEKWRKHKRCTCISDQSQINHSVRSVNWFTQSRILWGHRLYPSQEQELVCMDGYRLCSEMWWSKMNCSSWWRWGQTDVLHWDCRLLTHRNQYTVCCHVDLFHPHWHTMYCMVIIVKKKKMI